MVAYSLYKNAEINNMYELTVTDIYEKGYMGVSNIFNMDSESFMNALRGLTTNEVLSADLLGDWKIFILQANLVHLMY